MKFKKTLTAVVAALGLLSGAASAATFDLAFIMDRSGSVGSTNFNNAMDSLANALESSLVDPAVLDTYNVTIVTFASTATTEVTYTVTPGTTLATLQANLTDDIRNASYTGGRTCYECALAELGASTGDGGGIINMMTDGDPNAVIGDSNTTIATAQAAAIAERNALQGDGWDSLSFEAIGLDAAGEGRLVDLAFDTAGTGGQPVLMDPNLITDPLNSSFVLRVSGFGQAYDSAISAKVQRIVRPDPDPVPLPAGLPLILAGLGALGGLRVLGRKKA